MNAAKWFAPIAVLAASMAGLGAPSPSAHADEAVDACGAAAVTGQKLRRAKKLREAQSWFDVCRRPTCREDIRTDCTTWHAEVERLQPSIVVIARGAQGQLVTDARVLVDGAPALADSLASPIVLDPGTHTVDFEREGMNRISRTMVLGEGDRVDVSVIFDAAPLPALVQDERPLPTAAYVSGAVTAAGLVAFAVLGALGYADRGRSNCDTSCGASDADRVRTTFLVADISLAIAALAGAATTWLVLTRPAEPRVDAANTAESGQ